MKTKIGGQAVIEGVMMRGQSSMALAVRDELGQIRLDTTRLANSKAWYKKVPFVRGIINLVTSLIAGTKIIGKSAEVMVEDEIGSDEGMGGLMFVSTVIGFAFAMLLFVVLPTAITKLVFSLLKLDIESLSLVWLKSLLEGAIKMLILVGYMAGISQMKEIKRVFMYHGAEHKTIACYESELPLTVENVQKCSRYHDRCGTSFLVFVVLISVILMMVLDVVTVSLGFTAFVEQDNWWLRALLKICLLPLTAGVSYEVLMLLAKTDFVLFRPLKWLGKQFQKLTTREPDDSMCEVAITAFNTVLQMDADLTIAEQHFPKPLTLEQFGQTVLNSKLAQQLNSKDVHYLLSTVLNVDDGKLDKNVKIPYGWTLRLQKYIERIDNGEPYQYVVKNADFYGRKFEVNNDVLIPRMETELVTEQALKHVADNSKVLDLCCGSGIMGITMKLQNPSLQVTLADVSKQALKVAKANAVRHKAKVKFMQSDMFGNVKGKYDLIVCNPPYIESDTVLTLDPSVKDYEPILALDGGKDGLDFYRILNDKAFNYVTDNGALVMEIGYNQGDSVKKLFDDKYDVTVKKDYGGNDRIVIVKRK